MLNLRLLLGLSIILSVGIVSCESEDDSSDESTSSEAQESSEDALMTLTYASVAAQYFTPHVVVQNPVEGAYPNPFAYQVSFTPRQGVTVEEQVDIQFEITFISTYEYYDDIAQEAKEGQASPYLWTGFVDIEAHENLSETHEGLAFPSGINLAVYEITEVAYTIAYWATGKISLDFTYSPPQ